MDAPASVSLRVWDLPTRVFHWSIAAAVIAAIVSARIGGNAMVWHFRFGYAVLTLLAFRVLWGFVGGHWSRFARFTYGPGALVRYLRGKSRDEDFHDVGHSPLGALSVWAMIVILVVQVGTGLVADDEIANTGPLVRLVTGATSAAATAWHKGAGQWGIIALVVLHVLAVLWYALARRRNLVGAMWHGDKPLPARGVTPSADGARPRTVAALLLLACAAGVGWLVSVGG